MYFNNRHTARENENTLQKAIANSKTFEEHQVATAMFFTVLLNGYDGIQHGWTQNQLLGYMAPDTRHVTYNLQSMVDAAMRTLEGYGPQTANGHATILVDELLANDERFKDIPVGSVVLFKGLIDSDRWNMKSVAAKHLSIPGYFVSRSEFVVHDPVLAGSYLQGVTRWHGGQDTVGHLLQSGESLKLMNRPLSETHALAEVYYEHPSKSATVWLKAGMRFELRPDGSSLSRILTSPEDTQPHRTSVARHGAAKRYADLVAPTISGIDLAHALSDLPVSVVTDQDYSGGGVRGAGDLLKKLLAHNPNTCVANFEQLRDMLQAHGCSIAPKIGVLIGKDRCHYNFDSFLSRHSYKLDRADTMQRGQYSYTENCHIHQALVLPFAAFIQKYSLPPESLPGLMVNVVKICRPNHIGYQVLLCKLAQVLKLDMDVMKVMNYLTDDLKTICADVFAESRIARTRATYHDTLNTKQRKKLLAKFYPTV